MEKEILDKLKEYLLDELSNSREKLQELEENNKSALCDCVNKFLDSYKGNKEFSFELLEKFFYELPVSRKTTLDVYKKMFNYLKYLEEKNVTHLYKDDVKVINNNINLLIGEVNKYFSSLLTKIKKDGFDKRLLKEKIDTFEKNGAIILDYETSLYLSKSSFDVLCGFLKNTQTVLSLSEKTALIIGITKSNANVMQKQIDLLTKRIEKRTLRVAKEVEEKVENNKKLAVNTEKVKNIDESIEGFQSVVVDEQATNDRVDSSEMFVLDDSNNDLNGLDNLVEYQKDLYKNIKDICNTSVVVSSNVRVAAVMLKKEFSWENRMIVYDKLSLDSDKIALLVMDLRNIILPLVDEKIQSGSFDENITEFLEKINSYYNELSNNMTKSKKTSKDYITCLKEFNLSKQIEMCYQVDELLNNCLELKNSFPQLFYSTDIQLCFSTLKERKEEFEHYVLDCYDEGIEENVELLEIAYDDLVNEYVKLKEMYEKCIYSVPTRQEELIELAKEFYNESGPLNNIYLFVNDDGGITSIMEDDIEKSKNLDDKTYSAILSKLRTSVSDDFVAKGNHKAKRTESFSREFLEEYKVKSMRTGGSARIFYSRFNSTLGQLLGCKDPHIVFIHSIAYGDVDGTHKDDIVKEALNRCYKDKESIDNYRKLLSIDWNSLEVGESKKKKLQEEVSDYLNRQYIKLGHFIKVTNEKQKLLEERELD